MAKKESDMRTNREVSPRGSDDSPFWGIAGARVEELKVQKAISANEMVLDDSDGETGYWESSPRGLTFAVAEGAVESVFFHGEGKDGFSEFSGRLPAGLTFNMGRRDVRALLGQPERNDETLETPGFSTMTWDRFVVEGRFLHVTYRPGAAGIEMVTIELLEAGSPAPE